MHWFATYQSHHCQDFSMVATAHNRFHLYTPECLSTSCLCFQKVRGVTCLETDETSNIGKKTFVANEERCLDKFEYKETETLDKSKSSSFYGGTVSMDGNKFSLAQSKHVAKIGKFNQENFDVSSFVSYRSCGAYIASVSPLEMTFIFARALQVFIPTKFDVKGLYMAVDLTKSNSTLGLRYVLLRIFS